MSLNVILAATNASVPVVTPVEGMGATYFVGSDRYPFHVKTVISPREVVLQSATHRRTDNNGLSESQDYEIVPNDNGRTITVTLRKNGRWIEKGQKLRNWGTYLLGSAQAYSDPSF